MQWWVTGNGSPGSYVAYQAVGPRAGDTRGPFPNKAEAESTAGTLNKNAKLGVTGALASGASSAAKQIVNNAVPGLSQIGTFFSDLGQANTWIRVGEVLLGLILIAAGIAKLTHAVPIATKIAGAV